jgi:hypothetical protein
VPSVLLLNASCEPLRVVSLRRAVCPILRGVVEAVYDVDTRFNIHGREAVQSNRSARADPGPPNESVQTDNRQDDH